MTAAGGAISWHYTAGVHASSATKLRLSGMSRCQFSSRVSVPCLIIDCTPPVFAAGGGRALPYSFEWRLLVRQITNLHTRWMSRVLSIFIVQFEENFFFFVISDSADFVFIVEFLLKLSFILSTKNTQK